MKNEIWSLFLSEFVYVNFLYLFIKVEFCLGIFLEYSGVEYWGREDRDSDWVIVIIGIFCFF